jgi:urea transport system ATP-binding protein
MGGIALLVDAVIVEFGSFRAIDMLSLAIDFGEVRAVIGPNGAGKTTLLDVISGITRPKQGRVIFGDATDIVRASESQIARAGIRRKFQKPSIFEGLNVRQHIEIGAQGGLRRALPKEALRRCSKLWDCRASPAAPRPNLRMGRSSGSRSAWCWRQIRPC